MRGIQPTALYFCASYLFGLHFHLNLERERERASREREEEERAPEIPDKIIRQGHLRCYSYASSYPDIVSHLVEEMGNIVARMGIPSVRHLKDILPILSTALCDPFGVSLSLYTGHHFPKKDNLP